MRKYKLDESVFDATESNPEGAYWIGFAMADACVSIRTTQSPAIILHLAIADVGHVRSFAEFLRTEAPILFPSIGGARLSVTSSRLADELISHGVTPRKSKTAKATRLAGNKWFWTGVVDGDGSLGWDRCNSPVLGLVGSEFLMSQFLEFVKGNCPTFRGSVFRTKGIFGCRTTGQNAQKMASVLYDEAPFSLPRKSALATEFKQWKVQEPMRWHLTSPTGEVSICTNLATFCREHGLGIRCMAYRGGADGWKCVCLGRGSDGARPRQVDHSRTTNEELLRLQSEHSTYAAIAATIGLSPNRVAKLYRRRGIGFRKAPNNLSKIVKD